MNVYSVKKVRLSTKVNILMRKFRGIDYLYGYLK